MIRKITLNGRVVEYDFQRKSVKKINLSIKPLKGVRVSAPKNVTVKYIEKFMCDNSDFIINALDKFEKYADNLPKPKQYIDGEYIYYLGKPKKLVLNYGSINKAIVCGENIILTVKDTANFELKEKTINKLLLDECKNIVNSACKKLYPKIQRYGIAFPEIKYRKMVSCWGNCRSKKGIVTFNIHLVQTPIECIEFVVMHEFTHFFHSNHSQDFYRQLTAFMPDWKIYDQKLKSLQNEIIIRGK